MRHIHLHFFSVCSVLTIDKIMRSLQIFLLVFVLWSATIQADRRVADLEARSKLNNDLGKKLEKIYSDMPSAPQANMDDDDDDDDELEKPIKKQWPDSPEMIIDALEPILNSVKGKKWHM